MLQADKQVNEEYWRIGNVKQTSWSFGTGREQLFNSPLAQFTAKLETDK